MVIKSVPVRIWTAVLTVFEFESSDNTIELASHISTFVFINPPRPYVKRNPFSARALSMHNIKTKQTQDSYT